MRRTRVVLLGVLGAHLALGLPSAADSRDLDIRASDGVLLKGTLYSAGREGPGMLLLHQCNGDRTGWAALAEALTRKGINVLTFDYRGYGESGGKPAATLSEEEGRAASAKWPDDVDAALAALLAQPGVDRARIGAGGASCGVHQSIQLARRSGAIKALVLLSGGSKAFDEGRNFLGASPSLPIFGAASAEDGDAVGIMRRIVRLSTNRSSTLKTYNHAGHGVPMFDKEKSLLPAIADWLESVLMPGGPPIHEPRPGS